MDVPVLDAHVTGKFEVDSLDIESVVPESEPKRRRTEEAPLEQCDNSAGAEPVSSTTWVGMRDELMYKTQRGKQLQSLSVRSLCSGLSTETWALQETGDSLRLAGSKNPIDESRHPTASARPSSESKSWGGTSRLPCSPQELGMFQTSTDVVCDPKRAAQHWLTRSSLD